MCKDILSGIDLSGLDAKRCVTLAHAEPMDSFSNYSNARMSLRREALRDKEENE